MSNRNTTRGLGSGTATIPSAPGHADTSPQDMIASRDVLGRRWQYASYEVNVSETATFIAAGNELGAAGWELVSCAPLSRVSRFGTSQWWGIGNNRPGTTNRMVYVFKRQIA